MITLRIVEHHAASGAKPEHNAEKLSVFAHHISTIIW